MTLHHAPQTAIRPRHTAEARRLILLDFLSLGKLRIIGYNATFGDREIAQLRL
jgi:hypothetical protein